MEGQGSCCQRVCAWPKVCGLDLRDFLVYDVPKTARIRDLRLGLLYFFLVALIAAYILVFQLLRNNNYLSYQTPSATVRLTLQQPTQDGCNPNSDNCQDLFPSLESQPYCCRAICPRTDDGGCLCPWRAFTNYDCKYADGTEASTVMTDSILITTYAKGYPQRLNASCNSPGCSKLWINNGAPTRHFVVAIEDFTLLIDHSVAQQSLGVFRTSREMEGWLLVNGTQPLQNQLCHERSDAVTAPIGGWPADSAPCYIRPSSNTNDTLDIFKVSTLLQAMGTTLDYASYNGSGHSLRYEGLTAILQIEYFNTWPWHGVLKGNDGQTYVSYIYSLVSLDESPYKFADVTWTKYPDERIKRSLHGVYFAVAPGGRLAAFDPMTLLLTLTASLTLLALAATAVRYLAVFVLNHRKYYAEIMYDVSPDFSSVRELEEKDEAEITHILSQRGLRTSGTRPVRILRILKSGRLNGHEALPARNASSPESSARSSSSGVSGRTPLV